MTESGMPDMLPAGTVVYVVPLGWRRRAWVEVIAVEDDIVYGILPYATTYVAGGRHEGEYRGKVQVQFQDAVDWVRGIIEYHACTDCGVDRFEINEAAFQIRNRVWNLAYPGYDKGVGVGSSRPCIACLEKRLGRRLTRADFTTYGDINEPDAERHRPRLLDRLNTLP